MRLAGFLSSTLDQTGIEVLDATFRDNNHGHTTPFVGKARDCSTDSEHLIVRVGGNHQHRSIATRSHSSRCPRHALPIVRRAAPDRTPTLSVSCASVTSSALSIVDTNIPADVASSIVPGGAER